MSFAINNYTGNGSQTNYSVTFPYIVQSHVEVRLNNVLKTLGVDYTFPTSSTIQFITAPGNGVPINFKRNSSQTNRLVDYQDGSTITEAILDQDSNQMFYMSQEAIDATTGVMALDGDNKWNALNNVIKNVAAPINGSDAVNKDFISTNIPAVTTVASNINSVNNVSTNIANVNAVNSNSANINSAVANATNINAAVSNA
ncbi:MAG: uncultured phage MedDCM-OCT-S42-C7, partial [Pseudomonadota bacterium]